MTQIGNLNSASVNQTGTGGFTAPNTALITQIGNGFIASITQVGSGNLAGIYQH